LFAQNPIQRQFITINYILIVILLFCSQPVVWFGMAVEFWLPKPLTPNVRVRMAFAEVSGSFIEDLPSIEQMQAQTKIRETNRRVCV